jgi:mannosyltransferase
MVLAAGLFLRFFDSSHLWLDEALSVNIARLPLSHLTGALRQDGAPPLYYVILHGWIRVLGSSDGTVRALSGAFSVATAPVMWLLGRRLAGRRGGWVALLLFAASPFATHYATEARMYSLLSLLAAAALLAVLRALERPTTGRLAAVAALVALLLYTHYWSLYLLVAAGALLAWMGWRRDSAPARKVALALAVGTLAFVPWLPVFVFQARHTGTPWSGPTPPWRLPGVLGEYAGGGTPESPFNFVVLAGLLGLGLFGRIGLRPRTPASWLAGIMGTSLVVALVAGYLSHAALAPRYTAVIFPLFVLWVMLGVIALADRRALAAVLAATCVLGLGAAAAQATSEKSQAGSVAAMLNAAAHPGDLVVYCPDQLGPAVDRYLTVPVDQATWPGARPPQRVYWVDYKQGIRAADPAAFAREMVARAGGHTLWLVWHSGYPGLGSSCADLEQHLHGLRPAAVDVMAPTAGDYEREGVTSFPAHAVIGAGR